MTPDFRSPSTLRWLNAGRRWRMKRVCRWTACLQPMAQRPAETGFARLLPRVWPQTEPRPSAQERIADRAHPRLQVFVQVPPCFCDLRRDGERRVPGQQIVQFAGISLQILELVEPRRIEAPHISATRALPLPRSLYHPTPILPLDRFADDTRGDSCGRKRETPD